MITNENVKSVVRDLLANQQHDQLATLNVSGVTDMSDLFYGRTLPERLNLNEWDTSNVTNMSSMFQCCHNIPRIDRWDTEQVTDMSYMFAGYADNRDRYIYVRFDPPQDIGGWNTSNVTTMESMFQYCTFGGHATGIARWTTKKVTNMNSMFLDSDFNEDIHRWNTGNVTDMDLMFSECPIRPEFKPLTGERYRESADAAFTLMGRVGNVRLPETIANKIVQTVPKGGSRKKRKRMRKKTKRY